MATKSSDGKSKDSGVSQAAVQAFLAKKEVEKKKKAGKRNWSVLVSILLIPDVNKDCPRSSSAFHILFLCTYE